MKAPPLSADMAAFVTASQAFATQDPDITAQRQAYARLCAALAPADYQGLAISDHRAGGVPLRLVAPPGTHANHPALLYLHGGGWMLGDLDSHGFLAARLARRLGLAVLLVDYRLAPEHPYPAALDDARRAWDWLQREAQALGLDERRLAVAGDSAGGTLAAALCLALRQQGRAQPRAQALIYPALTAQVLPSERHQAQAPLLSATDWRACLDAYLPRPEDRRDPLALPLQAGDFSGLAPALVAVAQRDPLADHGRAYAAALRAGGTPSRLWEGAGLLHGALRAPGRRAEALRCVLERFLGGELGLALAANLSKDKKKPQPLETEEVQTP
ncbi:alpha/beta hydrolase [Pseudomonas sp. PLB05]|uniref:alpha/beta hydrolase n=1 Tax=Pseudomonas sp. PLB05 TaxID=2899078 RepID=UPI001E2C2416|nr:alpha/beta hydrolase [Pseudomonas sp. PLB05]MCD4863993.1 alpha/beta hydrolase [Pseudomonas sp. PLB05]